MVECLWRERNNNEKKKFLKNEDMWLTFFLNLGKVKKKKKKNNQYHPKPVLLIVKRYINVESYS